MGNVIRVSRWRRREMQKIPHSLIVDPRESPLYGLSIAAAIVGVPRGTLRHWARVPTNGAAIIELADPAEKFLSFANLLEAHILLSTQTRNIPLGNVRRAMARMRAEFPNSQHPLLEHDFYSVDGCRDVFIKEATGAIVNVSREGERGQRALKQVLQRHLKRIQWDRSGPVRLFPMRSERIVVDLNVSSAQPVVKGTGVLASIIASRNRAGDSVRELARDYRLKQADVEAAIKFIAA